jgi:hypothetical protein
MRLAQNYLGLRKIGPGAPYQGASIAAIPIPDLIRCAQAQNIFCAAAGKCQCGGGDTDQTRGKRRSHGLSYLRGG